MLGLQAPDCQTLASEAQISVPSVCARGSGPSDPFGPIAFGNSTTAQQSDSPEKRRSGKPHERIVAKPPKWDREELLLKSRLALTGIGFARGPARRGQI